MNDHPQCVVLLADIHANEAALLAVIRHARMHYAAYEPLRFWFLGDIFGRGPDAAGAWQCLLDLGCEAAVAGNHDWGLCGRSVNILVDGCWQGEFSRAEWQILLDQRKELGWLDLLSRERSDLPSGAVVDYVESLPVVSIPQPGVFLVHGGVRMPLEPDITPEVFAYRLLWEYVECAEHATYTLDALAALSRGQARLPPGMVMGDAAVLPTIVVIGHTHRRFLHTTDPRVGGWLQPTSLNQEYSWRVASAFPVVISLGSVGFSREHHSRAASYAVLRRIGENGWTIVFHEVPFNLRKVQEAMRALRRPEDVIRLLDIPGEPLHAGAGQALA